MFGWLIGDVTKNIVVLMNEIIQIMKIMMIGGGVCLFIIWITIMFKK